MCFRESLGGQIYYLTLFPIDVARASPTQPATECGLNGHHLWREVDWRPRHFAVRDAFVFSSQVVVEVKQVSSLLQTFVFTGPISVQPGQ